MQSYLVHKHYRPLTNWALNIGPQVTKLGLKFIHLKMESNFNVRWAFAAKNWQPTREEILAASSYIQSEEKERISKFYFKIDAKTSLLGRLMLRKFVHLSTSMPYDEIRFGRDNYGKPYLLGGGDAPISFNISHQGDYVVLAGHRERNIGIDIMKIEPPVNKNIPEFFRIMKKQFSHYEWAKIRSFPTELEQIACFYRIWCLKESYVKNTGFGITVSLDEISFSLKTDKLKVGELISNSVLYERNVLKKDWVFEETLLDATHAVAVSLQMKEKISHEAVPYIFLTFDGLVKEAKALLDPDQRFTDDFMAKKLKPF